MRRYSGTIQSAPRAGGFSLLELMVTLSVAAILLVVAVPSYRSVVQRNSVTANVNDLVGDLNYARSEAVTRGESVFICSSKNHTSCSNDGDWGAGWIVFYGVTDPKTADPNTTGWTLLRVQDATGSGFSLSTSNVNPMGFDANGFATSLRTFTAQGDDTNRQIQVTVAATGRVETNPVTP